MIAAGVIAALCCQPSSADCTKDAFELDYNAATGTVLVGGTSQQRNFCDDSEDWISIPVCPGRSYSLDTSALGPAADTLIEIYAPDGTTLLAFDDDAGPDPEGNLEWSATCAVGCTMHARVRQRDGTNGDHRDYRVRLTGDTSPCSSYVRSVHSPTGQRMEFDAIAQAVDGGFVTVGSMNATFTFTRWNNDGTIGWVRKVGGAGAREVARTADGGFVGLASSSPFGPTIAKLTDAGELTWQRIYDGVDLFGLDASEDGSIFASGWVIRQQDGGELDGWLLKLNASGTPIWSRSFGSNGFQFLSAVRATEDGGAVAVGVDGAEGGYRGLLVEVNAESTIVRQLVFHTSAATAFFESVRPLAAGGYVVGGGYCPTSQSCRALLLKLNAAGGIVWQRTLEWPSAARDERVMSIDILADGSIYAHVVRLGAQFEPIVTRWSAHGTLVWDSSLGEIESVGTHGIAADDGSIMVAYGEGQSSRLVRVYSSGNLPSCVSASPRGNPGLPTLTASASGFVTDQVDERGTLATVAVASPALSPATLCCSRVLGPPIHVSGRVNTEISWANDGFGPYDVVRGDLATLKSTGGDFTAALDVLSPNEQCLAQGSSATLVVDSYAPPFPGTGYFYLVRGGGGACPTLYDESVNQLGERDAEITAASGSCP